MGLKKKRRMRNPEKITGEVTFYLKPFFNFGGAGEEGTHEKKTTREGGGFRGMSFRCLHVGEE